jgi:hypothetical protein
MQLQKKQGVKMQLHATVQLHSIICSLKLSRTEKGNYNEKQNNKKCLIAKKQKPTIN